MNLPEISSGIKIAVSLIVVLSFTGITAGYSGGSGTKNDPYQVSQCSHFENISGSSYFELTQNIDCSSYDYGINYDHLGGELDGNGYKVSNIEFYHENCITDAQSASCSIIRPDPNSPPKIANLTMENLNYTLKYASGSDSGSLVEAGIFGSYDNTNYVSNVENFELKNSKIKVIDEVEGDPRIYGISAYGNFNDIVLDNVEYQTVSDVAGSGGEIVAVGLNSEGYTPSNIEIRNSLFNGTNPSGYAGDSSEINGIIQRGNSISNIIISNTTYQTGTEPRYAHGVSTAMLGDIENIKIVDSEIISGADSRTGFIGSNSNAWRYGYLRNVELTLLDSDGNAGLLSGDYPASTVSEFYIAESSNNDYLSGDHIFGVSDGSGNEPSTVDAVYFDKETTDITKNEYGAINLTTSEMTGSSAESNMNFDFNTIWRSITGDYPELQVFYAQAPVVTPVSPQDGSSFYQYEEDVNFEADISTQSESADVSFIVNKPSGTNETIYTVTQSPNSVETQSYTTKFNNTGSYDYWVEASTSSYNVVEYGGSFNIDSYEYPSINLDKPNDQATLYADYQQSDQCPSNLNGECKTVYSDIDLNNKAEYNASITAGTESLSYTLKDDDGDQITGNLDSGQTTTLNTEIGDKRTNNNYNWNVETTTDNYSVSNSSTSRSYSINEVNVPPQITLFESTPNISSAGYSDVFDLEVKGDIGDDPVNNVTYSMSVTNNPNPSDTVVNNVGQTSSEFQDYRSDVYQMKKDYCGETITFNVVVKDDAGRSDSSSISGSTTTDKKPNVTALNPNEGDVLEVAPGNVRNPGYQWEIVTYSENVDVTFYENGNPISDGTYDETKSQTCKTFSESFDSQPERGAGSYTYQVEVTDQSGRTATSDQISYSIEEKEEPSDVPPTMTTIQHENPRIQELEDGDTPDIYFEGDEGTEAIDYVELKVKVDGQVEKTIVVPEEDIKYGSFYSTVTDAYQFVSDWVGSQIEIVATVFGKDGSTSTTSISGTASSDVGATADITNPGNNEIITYSSPDSTASVNYNFTVSTEDKPVDISLVRNGSTIYTAQQLSSDSTIPYDYNEDLSSGTYEIWVDLDNANTGNDEYESAHRTFTVQEDTGDPIISWTNPSDGDTFFYDQGEDYSSVDYDGTITTPEDGTINLKIGGTTVNSVDVQSGDNVPFSMTENLTVGNYTTYLNFQSASFDKDTGKREFGVLEEEPAEPSVYLADPDDNSVIQLDSDYPFKYYLKANRTGTVSMEIREKDTGNVFYSSPSGNEYDYDKLNNYAYYTESVKLDQEGEYEWDATFNADDGTKVTSFSDDFTVKDIATPSFNLSHPEEGDVFTTPIGGQTEVYHNASIDLTEFSSSDNLDVTFTLNAVNNEDTEVTETHSGGQIVNKSIIGDLAEDSYTYSFSVETPDGAVYSSNSRTYDVVAVDQDNVVKPQFPVNESFEIQVGSQLDIDHTFTVDSSAYDSRVDYTPSLDLWKNGNIDTSITGNSETAGNVTNHTYNIGSIRPDDPTNSVVNTSAVANYVWESEADFSNGDNYQKNSSYTVEYMDPLKIKAVEKPQDTYSLDDTDQFNVDTVHEVNASGLYHTENYTVNRTITRNGLVYEPELELGEGSGNETTEFEDSVSITDPGTYVLNITATHNESNTSVVESHEFKVYGNYRIDEFSPENGTTINTRVPTDQEVRVELFTQEDSGTLELYWKGTKVREEYVDVDSSDNTTVTEIRDDTYLINYTAEDIGEGEYNWRFRFVPDSNELPEIDRSYNFKVKQGLWDLVTGVISDAYDRLVATVPGIALFMISAVISLFVAVWTRSASESDEIAILSLVLSTLFFVALGWMPGWVGMIIFLIAVAVGMYMVSKVTTGSGGD